MMKDIMKPFNAKGMDFYISIERVASGVMMITRTYSDRDT